MVVGWSTNMQNLVVQVLTMRQLGRLNPRHLLAAGYGMRQTEWCPRTIHTRQLWGCSAFPALGCHRLSLHGREPVKSWSVHHLRLKSSKKKKGAERAAQGEEDNEEEEEKDPEDSDYEDEVGEDPNQPKDYTDVERFVPSFRYDIVLKNGLDMTRNKVEDAFYSNKLRLNGQNLIKKSKTVKLGDTLDIILSESQEKNTVTLMRVVIMRVFSETTKTEKYKVALRRWKHLELPKDHALAAFKP